MEWQFRNWYHFNWLSGDQVLQQLIHSIDKAAWVLGDGPPVKAWGMGGRANCFGPNYGDLFDHQRSSTSMPTACACTACAATTWLL